MTKKKKRCLILAVILLLCIGAGIYYSQVSLPLLRTMATEEIKAEVTDMVNYTNGILQDWKFFYDDFFTIHRNEEGDIEALTANTGLINQLKMIATTELQNQANTLRGKKVYLSAGSLTGSAFLAGFGSRIGITIQSVGSCKGYYVSNFQSMGINQTLHRLCLVLVIEMEILIPLKTISAIAKEEIIFGETLIVGKVPDTYLTENSTNYLDLVP